MKVKDVPVRVLNMLRGKLGYRLGGTYFTEMSIPPGLNYSSYLQAYGEIGWLFGAVCHDLR